MDKVTVFTTGCFNRLHQAHLTLLTRARALGDRLVVGLSNDAHNKKPNAVPSALRLKRLSALGIADEILVGDPHRFAGTLEKVCPSILVLGYDQKFPDEETARLVSAKGIHVIHFPWFPGKDEDL